MTFCAPSSFLGDMVYLSKMRRPTGDREVTNTFLLERFLMYLGNDKYKVILNGELEIS